jgi:hypothetical protein
MNKKSELALASAVMRVFARYFGSDLPNLHVSYHDNSLPSVEGKNVYVPVSFGSRQSFLAACTEVLHNSLNKFGFTADPQEVQAYQAFCIGISSIIYGEPKPPMESPASFGFMPTSFVLIRDGVCPVLGIPFDDLAVKSCVMPGDLYCDKDCLCISCEIHDPVVEAAIMVKYFVERHDPRLVAVLVKDDAFRRYLNNFLNESYGIASSSLLLFLLCSMNGLNIESYGADVFESSRSPVVKTAQTSPSFWLFGLIEKMLAPSRSANPHIKEKWAPVVDALYSAVDKERRRKGLTGAPLEFMLRVQAGPNSQGVSSTLIQSMLEDSRSW